MQIESTTESIPVDKRLAAQSMLLLLVVVGGLFVYKSGAALSKLGEVHSTGTFQANITLVLPDPGSSRFDVLARSANYLVLVGPALLFGILIAGAVRTRQIGSRRHSAASRSKSRSQPAWRACR